MAHKPDWIAIEAAYRGGSDSIRAIAEQHGISEGAIRKQAKKHKWQRDPEGLKRERVRAFMSDDGAQKNAPRTPEELVLQREVEEDVRLMRAGVSAASYALAVAHKHLKQQAASDAVADYRETKGWMDCVTLSIATIRRIRGLDDRKDSATPIELKNPWAKL